MTRFDDEKTKQTNGSPKDAARRYSKPELQEFGNVSELTRENAMSLSVDGAGMTGDSMTGSDPALKEDIVRIGAHPLGMGLYLFNYKPEFREIYGHGRQFGVMADEVVAIAPDAVSRNADGFLVVDYARLGITQHKH